MENGILLPCKGTASSLEEFVKAGVIPKGAYSWVDADIGQADSILFVCLEKPAERLVGLAKQRIDNSNLISRDPVLLALGDEVFENRPCFFRATAGSQHVCSLGAGVGRLAGEGSLLFVNRQGFIAHAPHFIRPPEDDVRGNRTWIQFKR